LRKTTPVQCPHRVFKQELTDQKAGRQLLNCRLRLKNKEIEEKWKRENGNMRDRIEKWKNKD